MRFPEPQPLPSTRFANLALGLDAAFCNIVGLVFTLTGAFMSDWLGVPGWAATLFGITVLLWSFVVTLYANRRVARRREVVRVIVVNVLFVVAAIAVVAVPGSLSNGAKVLAAAGIVIVACFAAAQAWAVRTLG